MTELSTTHKRNIVVENIERPSSKVGVTMEEIPGKWDEHFEEMIKKLVKECVS